MLSKLHNLLLRRGLARVTITLAMALVIMLLSTYFTIVLTRKRLANYADAVAEQKSVYVNKLTDMLFLSNEWIINSYLSGMAQYVVDTDSVTSASLPHYVLSDQILSQLTVDDIYARLRSFMDYHSDYRSAIMLFEPGVLDNHPERIAAKVSNDDTLHYELSLEYNVFRSSLYNTVRNSRGMSAKAGYIMRDSIFMYTIGMPFYNENGRFIGELWIDTDADYMSDMLISQRADSDVTAAFISTDCRIVASSNRENNGKYIKDISIQVCGGYFPREWYSKVQAAATSNKYSHFRYRIASENIVTYIFPIEHSQYKLLIIKPERLLYSKVNGVVWLPFTIMIASIFMIAACLIYIFFVVKKKNDESNLMEGELNIAAKIQRSILPSNPVTSDISPYYIYGFQRPARTMGGDLYDFVCKDDLLHFCIGDVSGKGMPAAMVMAELCSLYRYIVCYHSDPQEIMTLINKSVMEHSDDSMFCTLFVGVLDLKSGLLRFCNAGHNPPIFISKDGADFMRIKPNMPIYAFADYEYHSESLQLSPGDRLYLYTDGVTETKNEANRFFGDEATLTTIKRVMTLPFDLLVLRVMGDLRAFAHKAEQHDDITMLCLEYRGIPSLHFDGVKGRVVEIVDAVLQSCSTPDDMRLRLAVEESVQNISDYAYPEDGPLDIEISKDNASIRITLTDNGKPFNPLDTKAPDLTLPVMDRQIGGLGIFLTLQTMDEVTYRYDNNQNHLTLKYTPASPNSI